jgi:hypothetical protein
MYDKKKLSAGISRVAGSKNLIRIHESSTYDYTVYIYLPNAGIG